ncbi:hypothetical protein E4U54_005667 [Claviceps lovelessii]|nr:hypothetical protein E4U54_005667 [Claviceps lovelessii]
MRTTYSTALAVVFSLVIPSISAHVARQSAKDGSCKKTSVAILGGGMAGITAAVSVKLQPFLKSKKSQRFTVFVAKTLANNSITDFIIIEYNERIGGRATNAEFGQQKDGSPYKVEIGANWKIQSGFL